MINFLQLSTRFYGSLYNRKHLHKRFLSPIRGVTRALAQMYLPKYLEHQTDFPPQRRCKDVIISLTSFPARINDAWLSVSSLLYQTWQPYKIILWLSKEQFKSADSIPQKLIKLQNDIFEIRFVEGDIRSHKKYLYSFTEFNEYLIITVDDDIYYSSDMVECLVKEHYKNPKDIICMYGRVPTYTSNGDLENYSNWKGEYDINEENFFFGSGGGTLFQPSLMYKDTLNIDLSLKLTPTADDIWLNAMARLANLHIRVISKQLFLPVNMSENIKLSTLNVENNMNDIQLANVMDYYELNVGINPFKNN